ncbi:AraC family transcriptional regulator ligand-binding domain-containing protein [Tistrella mobilis]|uniref:AraC family transcriptional regulator n=1 Tax=Tistrella mobilis TaxID=171437 RepID=UPI003558EC5E
MTTETGPGARRSAESEVPAGTISAHLVAEALEGAHRLRLDTGPVLRSAGIDPVGLTRPGARVDAETYARLWRGLTRLLDDEFFAMNRRRMKRGSFGFMCATAREAPDLGAALRIMTRFMMLVFDDIDLRLLRHGTHAQLVMRGRRPTGGAPLPPPRAFADFTIWLMLHGAACWLVGRRIPIRWIDVRARVPAYTDDYRRLFCNDLRFGQPDSRLVFDAELLDLPIDRSRRSLTRFLKQAPGNILVRYRNADAWLVRVRHHLRGLHPDDWPDIDSLATAFGISTATLHRRLAAEGQSYRAIKDALRLDIAIDVLRDPTASVADAAAAAGFADPSSFHRAFRKWTGQSPGRYRAEGG